MKLIKEKVLLMLLFIFKWHLRGIYFFIKLFTKQKRRVFFLSRQFNFVPINYEFIIEELKKENIDTKVICKKVSNGLNGLIRNEKNRKSFFKDIVSIIGYYFNLYKQMYYIATSKVVIIDGYNLTVSILKHKKNTRVIQMWHALAAIKKFGYQTIGYPDGLNPKIAKMLCMHKNYDYVISGSKAMNKYFAEAFNVPIEKVIEVGTPMIDYLLKDDNEKREEIFSVYPQMKEKINILYSPTFRSDGRDNTQEVIEAVDTKKYNLIFTFHPKNNIIVSKDVISIDSKQFSTFDILKNVDYVITDYSALSIDACVLNKKLLLYVYDYEKYNEENGININLFEELQGAVSENIKDLIEIIDNDSYNMEKYQEFRHKYVSNLNGDSTQKILKIIKEAL